MSVRNRIRTLALSTTAMAVAFAGGALAQPIEEVVVTGSHIRGVAPVGSTIVSVGQDDLQKTGVASTSDLLMRVPQFVNLGSNEQTAVGGTRIQGAAGNTTFSRSLNLRGIGGGSTLTLYNGQRFTRNSLADSADIDMFPISLVERIEVVADGGSATYGSDAVAGTANVILREPTDIIQTQGQVGIKNGSMDWQFMQTLGTTWDAAGSGIGDGGLMIAYVHSYTDPIDAADRSSLYNDDLTPYLGAATGAQPAFAAPANTRGYTTGGTAVLYPTPGGIGSTTPLNLSQVGTAGVPNRTSVWYNAFPLPRITRDTIAGVFKQELTDWLDFSFMGTYMRRTGAATYGTTPQTTSSVVVPNTNPYSPCRAGAPPDTSAPVILTCPAGGITMQYNWTNELGTTQQRQFSQDQYDMQARFDFDLPYEWHGKLTGFLGRDNGSGVLNPLINNTALTQVLGGVGKPANVPFFNPFCDNSAGPCNSATTIAYVSAMSANTNTNWLTDYNLGFDGPLFDLPGGTVRAAFGGEWYRQMLHVYNYNTTSAAIGTQIVNNNAKGYETVRAVYGELYVPIIGDANSMPGIQKLELTLAGRITDYTSFGTTRDPKIGFNWNPVLDVKVRGSWGTSFRAPNLRENDPFSAASLFIVNTATCGQYTGITCATPGTSISLISNTGGNAGLVPETATTWSLGADWTPDSVPGLFASLNYYNIDVKDRLNQATRSAGDIAIANGGIYDAFVRFNPTYFPTRAVNNQPYTLPTSGTTLATNTQAAYDNFLVQLRADPVYANNSTLTTFPVAFFYDGRFINAGVLQTDGLDFQARYDFDTEWGGATHVGIAGNYTLSYKETAIATAPLVDNVNTFGANQQFRFRAEGGFQFHGLDITAYVNHVGGYDMPAQYLPAAALANPAFGKIDSYTTADLSLVYKTSDELSITLLRNLQVAAIFTNVFDTLPPFVLNAASTTPVLFDPNVGSAVGRLITLRVTKDW